MAETIDADSASWDEIKATSILTGFLAVVLTVVFEIARRNPAVSAVFDRRRGRYAHRTPPPLLRNTILEWLFLSNADGYKKYAVLSHMRDVITERWRQKKKLKKLKERFSKNESWSEDQPNTENNDSGTETDNTNSNSSQYQMRQRAAKLTHYLTPDAVEFNGRRLPAEIAEYAMAGDLTERQLDDYEQRLLHEEEKEEVEFNFLRDEMITNAGGGGGGGRGKPRRDDVEDQQDVSSITSCANQNPVNGTGTNNLILPPRESRLRFFGFQQGKVNEGKTHNAHAITPSTPSSQETFRHMLEKGKSKFFSTLHITDEASPSASSPQSLIQNQDVRVNHHVNRHLKSTSVSDIRPLTSSDRETLRCIGLDYFVMIRFLRLCFTITFYPFLISCITLIPTYYTNQYDGVNDTNEKLVINEQTDGYFRFTVNRLEQSSDRLWVTCSFALFFYCFVLRRLWIEWETFIVLRFEFLANGDADYEEALAAASRPNDFKKRRRTIPKKDDVRLHLEQFRNSCIVEYIPESHQRDQELFQFFDSVFPGQVRRAEIMINPPNLNDLIARRQAAIELYEQFYAKHNHDKQTYSQKMKYLEQKERTVFDRCYRCNTPQKPIDPTMNPSADSSSLLRKCCCCYELLCGENKVKALPYLSAEIKKLNREVENEYQMILDEKRGVEDRAAPMYQGILDAKVAGAKTFLTGVGEELTGSTGFVEFTTLTAKQSALQCNLTGTTRYMVTTSAPDPRDVIWENVTVEHKTISIKKIQFDGLLFTGTLFWSVAVSAVTSISNIDLISKYLPAQLVPGVDTFWYDLIQGYLPVVLLELLMILITFILGIIARRFIRFKTNSEEMDSFSSGIWHTVLPTAKVFLIGVGGELTGSTGFVEFTTLTAKQSAVQCNLTGTTKHMVTTSAPDPRDVIWENVTVEHKTICIKKTQFDGLLFIGTLFWCAVVSAVTSITDLDLIAQYLPAQLIPGVDTFLYDIIQGFLPVVLLELLMILVTLILEFIARRFIRFKTHSEVDGFVFKWHLAYRVANLVIIIVNRQMLKTVNLLRTNPQAAMDSLVTGIAFSSQFFLNNMIVATGTELLLELAQIPNRQMLKTVNLLRTNPQAAMDSLVTGIAFSSQFFLNNMIVATGTELLLELAQIPKILYHFVLHKYITVEATSKRVLDELKVPESLEWGETIPPFIFGLLIAMVYSTLVPLVTGVCAFYFYLAAKVYTHQSLFVYAQLYEGGGVIMYQLNRSIFVIIYISIVIFSVLFSLKKDRMTGLVFGIMMTIITVLVDIKITKDFVKPSITLALTNARVIDEENKQSQDESRQYLEYRAKKRERQRKKRREEERQATNNLEELGVSLNKKFEDVKDVIDENESAHSEIKNDRNTYIPALRVSPKYKNKSRATSSSSQVSSRSGGNPPPLTSDSNKLDKFNNYDEFYLYRQPQLNKALW
eukprot:CAMPEP_0198277244 /NCGR_PEP_ID=MMETSP1447-20131203/65739_1 /TAXON_ID=420782 /ORGANISM="Chaetoceros dichaeta, Strain CCMP1751" /LENGTH=1436 /DNA_ID=CAMNT_0043972247 /DNA_START=89 /DNA_END=4397 /DNA_ORIENTATION=-